MITYARENTAKVKYFLIDFLGTRMTIRKIESGAAFDLIKFDFDLRIFVLAKEFF